MGIMQCIMCIICIMCITCIEAGFHKIYFSSSIIVRESSVTSCVCHGQLMSWTALWCQLCGVKDEHPV